MNYKEVDNNKLVGIEVMTLKEAVEKSEKELFDLVFQSNLSIDTYGVLKDFHSREMKGYGFVPILINKKLLTA